MDDLPANPAAVPRTLPPEPAAGPAAGSPDPSGAPSAAPALSDPLDLQHLPPPAPPPEALGGRAFFLFLPFYTPPDPERMEEILYCLRRNLDSGLFARIVLLIDDDSPLPFPDRRLVALRLGRRPSYLDWVRAARRLCPGHVAVLVNSDIHIDTCFGRLLAIFAQDPKAFVALTRFDRQGDALVPHPNPHWSQDCWAFLPGPDDDTAHDARLDVPLGVPRCDNKIAYLFGTQGFTVYNPFPFLRTVHVHETARRYYHKTGDRRVIGTVAYVHPSESLTAPARLDLDVWTMSVAQITGVKLNRTLEKWAEEARLEALPHPTWLAHDDDWQYPAITERHAFHRLREELPETRTGRRAVYLAFPFATLIDLMAVRGENDQRTRALRARLDALAATAKGYGRVVSVAQHIRAREFARVFAAAGVTDLFWSHCIAGEATFAEAPSVRLHPFPLYPVQQVPRGAEDVARPRRWLFSFVGARTHKMYLSNVREMIVELLGNDPRGCVVARGEWHYEKIVYQAQVLGRVAETAAGLVADDHSAEFRDILDQSVFALCPSGTGPNSIRLWEAMVNGAIPVILSDSWAAPGDPALWEAATLRVPETPTAIATLPHRLATIAADDRRLQAMRASLMTLDERYGPEGFVGDVLALLAPDHR